VHPLPQISPQAIQWRSEAGCRERWGRPAAASWARSSGSW